MEITLQEAINYKEINMNGLTNRSKKWLMFELLNRKIDFQVINNILKRI